MLVIVAGLGALGAACVLLHHAIAWTAPARWKYSLALLLAFLALAGALKFCYDLIAYSELWRDPSPTIALLNFVGLLMINSFGLLPALVGCVALHFIHRRADG